jgi:dTMP kinase
VVHSGFAKTKRGEYQSRSIEMSRAGFFITFEGSEGCGKSTQIALLADKLRRAGREPLLIREPGGTTAGESIRHLLQHAPEGEALVPEAELLLFAASRAQLVREKILPALEAGRIVISDRFLDSTTVYQGVARRIPAADTARINAFAVGACRPDVTFVLDLDRPTSLARMRTGKRQLDRIERESEEFFSAVRQGYLELAKTNPDRVVLLDASRPAETTAAEIDRILGLRAGTLFAKPALSPE